MHNSENVKGGNNHQFEERFACLLNSGAETYTKPRLWSKFTFAVRYRIM
jgi:hypothetical protein